MNKQSLIKKVAQFTPTNKDAVAVVNLILDSIKDALLRDDKVVLSGFGSFYPKMRRAKNVRHPKSGKMITISPKKAVKFIPSPNLFR